MLKTHNPLRHCINYKQKRSNSDGFFIKDRILSFTIAKFPCHFTRNVLQTDTKMSDKTLKINNFFQKVTWCDIYKMPLLTYLMLFEFPMYRLTFLRTSKFRYKFLCKPVMHNFHIAVQT